MPRFLAALFLVIAVFACNAAPAARSSRLQAQGNLSPFFNANCVTCHGANGDEGFAPLLSVVAYADYVHSVRGGHPDKGVPAFDAAEYPLSVLNHDFTIVTGQPAR